MVRIPQEHSEVRAPGMERRFFCALSYPPTNCMKYTVYYLSITHNPKSGMCRS